MRWLINWPSRSTTAATIRRRRRRWKSWQERRRTCRSGRSSWVAPWRLKPNPARGPSHCHAHVPKLRFAARPLLAREEFRRAKLGADHDGTRVREALERLRSGLWIDGGSFHPRAPRFLRQTTLFRRLPHCCQSHPQRDHPRHFHGGHVGGLVAGASTGWLFQELEQRRLSPLLPVAMSVGLAGTLFVGSLWAATLWMNPTF